MSSLMTNAAAMTALQTLSSTNRNLETTQNRISTGFRVATASDNAAYWSIATTMRADNKALSAVSDALGLGAATVDTMYTALVGTESLISDLSAKLVAARTPGVDRGKIQAEIEQIQLDLADKAGVAVFNGENWLSVDSSKAGYNDIKTIVSGFSRVGGQVAVRTVEVSQADLKLYDGTDVVGTQVEGTTTGTWNTTGGATTIDIDVTDPDGNTVTTTINVAQDATIEDVVKQIKEAGIEGLSVATDGDQLFFALRDTENEVTIDAAGPGLDAVTLAAPATNSDKGILDKNYAYFDGTQFQEISVSEIDIGSLTNSAEDLAILEQYIDIVASALNNLTDAATDLGSVKSRVDSTAEFTKSLIDAVSRGIGQLVDADMNAESTRLQALQVQQQLGIQALSIANANSQNILSLFR
jgi:flagellin